MEVKFNIKIRPTAAFLDDLTLGAAVIHPTSAVAGPCGCLRRWAGEVICTLLPSPETLTFCCRKWGVEHDALGAAGNLRGLFPTSPCYLQAGDGDECGELAMCQCRGRQAVKHEGDAVRFCLSAVKLTIIAKEDEIPLYAGATIWPLPRARWPGAGAKHNLAGDYFPLAAPRPFRAKQNTPLRQSYAALRPHAVR